MVATWLIVGGAMLILGGVASGFAYFGGKASAYKTIAESATSAGGSGFLTWISNLIFGDSLSGIFNNVIVLVVVAVIVFLIIKYFLSRRRKKTVSYRYN